MKKAAQCSLLFLILNGIVLAQASGAQAQTSDPEKPSGIQNDGSKCVKIAVINSQTAFEQSIEGHKLLGKIEKLSKNKRDEEMQRIRREMVELVDKIAREKGYGLVLDLQTSGVICYLAPVDDLTDELIKRYNSLIR
jgi:Skp family chaperone for outer membrane proteins